MYLVNTIVYFSMSHNDGCYSPQAMLFWVIIVGAIAFLTFFVLFRGMRRVDR